VIAQCLKRSDDGLRDVDREEPIGNATHDPDDARLRELERVVSLDDGARHDYSLKRVMLTEASASRIEIETREMMSTSLASLWSTGVQGKTATAASMSARVSPILSESLT
jgi:hypothetical protein